MDWLEVQFVGKITAPLTIRQQLNFECFCRVQSTWKEWNKGLKKWEQDCHQQRKPKWARWLFERKTNSMIAIAWLAKPKWQQTTWLREAKMHSLVEAESADQLFQWQRLFTTMWVVCMGNWHWIVWKILQGSHTIQMKTAQTTKAKMCGGNSAICPKKGNWLLIHEFNMHFLMHTSHDWAVSDWVKSSERHETLWTTKNLQSSLHKFVFFCQ